MPIWTPAQIDATTIIVGEQFATTGIPYCDPIGPPPNPTEVAPIRAEPQDFRYVALALRDIDDGCDFTRGDIPELNI